MDRQRSPWRTIDTTAIPDGTLVQVATVPTGGEATGLFVLDESDATDGQIAVPEGWIGIGIEAGTKGWVAVDRDVGNFQTGLGSSRWNLLRLEANSPRPILFKQVSVWQDATSVIGAAATRDAASNLILYIKKAN